MPKLSEEFDQWLSDPIGSKNVMKAVSAALEAIEEEPRAMDNGYKSALARITELEAQQPPFHPTYVQTLQERITELEAEPRAMDNGYKSALVRITELEAELENERQSARTWPHSDQRIKELETDSAIVGGHIVCIEKVAELEAEVERLKDLSVTKNTRIRELEAEVRFPCCAEEKLKMTDRIKELEAKHETYRTSSHGDLVDRIEELEAQQPPFHPTYVQTLQERITELEAEPRAMDNGYKSALVRITELEADKQITGQWLEQNAKTISELEDDNRTLKLDYDSMDNIFKTEEQKVIELEAEVRDLKLQVGEYQMAPSYTTMTAKQVQILQGHDDEVKKLESQLDRIKWIIGAPR